MSLYSYRSLIVISTAEIWNRVYVVCTENVTCTPRTARGVFGDVNLALKHNVAYLVGKFILLLAFGHVSKPVWVLS